MIASERLLLRLVDEGKLTFTMADMEGKRQSERQLLYRLGAYKGVQMPPEFIHIFGIKDCKRLIDTGTNLKTVWPEMVVQDLYAEELSNYEGLVTDKVVFEDKHQYYLGRAVRHLRSWKGITRGKDLFIKGLGGFEIEKAFDEWSQASGAGYREVPTRNELLAYGYLDMEGIHRYSLDKTMKKLMAIPNMFEWVVKRKFSFSRLDEMFDAHILGLFDHNLTLIQMTNRLDDAIHRGLKLTWDDKVDFDYPTWLGYVASGTEMTIPKNGIELKSQAKRFKNCAGGYVNSILDKRSYIIYNKDVMVELSPSGRVIQAHGPMNSTVNIDFLYRAIDGTVILHNDR